MMVFYVYKASVCLSVCERLPDVKSVMGDLRGLLPRGVVVIVAKSVQKLGFMSVCG